jgi:VIT1/CCC1 family predicted Fe2+/Mn2+ transporter
MARDLDAASARSVAQQLMAHDALGAHARDELGISSELAARPLQAAWASAASFAVGAGVPLVALLMSPINLITLVVSASSIACLAALGALAARTAQAPLAPFA